MIDSVNTIEVYEEDGQQLNTIKSNKPSIVIKNHWNRRQFVVVQFGDKSYTVNADDLHKAIVNATNSH